MIKYYFIADHLEAFLNSNAYTVKHYTLGIIYIHTAGWKAAEQVCVIYIYNLMLNHICSLKVRNTSKLIQLFTYYIMIIVRWQL